MSINDIFMLNQFNSQIRKKVQKNTTFLFPKIYSSSYKNQSSNKNNQNKKFTTDKDLYIPLSSNKNVSLLTNNNFYTSNPKQILTSKSKSFQLKDSLLSNKIKQISLNKQSHLQKQKFHQYQSKIRQTQRHTHKFRTTFVAQSGQKFNLNSQNLINPIPNQSNNAKRVIGNYQVVKQLGHGGFAKVYQVVNKQTNLKYAMKQYLLSQSLQCYLNQVKIGQFYFFNNQSNQQVSKYKGISSIIKFIQKIKNNKKGFIIQQIGGQNFSKIISQIKGTFYNKQRVYQIKFLPFYQKLKNINIFRNFMTQICEGIKLLNKTGFVHCDLKLQNILIDFKDNQTGELPIVKIIDFGSTFQISKGLPKITITPQYMPPQLLQQFDKNNYEGPNLQYQKIDVWSIGCIMLQIFTGVPLWFRYKCKVCSGDRTRLQLGIFALTNRDYTKIVKKQQQLCDSLVKSINFASQEWQKYRGILKQIFVMNPQKRISIQSLIQKLNNIK